MGHITRWLSVAGLLTMTVFSGCQHTEEAGCTDGCTSGSVSYAPADYQSPPIPEGTQVNPALVHPVPPAVPVAPARP